MEQDNLREWEQLSPTGKPNFPIRVFPKWIQKFVLSLHEETDAPIDYFAGVILSIGSACVFNRADIVLDNRTQPLILHTIICGRSGTRKTTAFALSKPFERWALQANKPIRHNNRFIREEIEALKSQKRKAKTIDQAEECKKKITELERSIRPKYPYPLSDVTPEFVAQEASESNGAAVLISDEGGALNVISGKAYSAVSGYSNIDIFLKGYDRNLYTRGRVGVGSTSFYPSIVMCIGTQPEMLREYVSNGQQVERGIIQRAIYFFPDFDFDNVDPFNRKPCPTELMQKWSSTVSELLERDKDTEFNLVIDQDAHDLLKRFEERNAKKVKRLDDSRYVEWLSKNHDRAGRIAGILTLLENPKAERVSADTTSKAILLCEEYCALMTAHAFCLIDSLPTYLQSMLHEIISMAEKQSEDGYTTKGDLYRNLRNWQRYYGKTKRQFFDNDLQELIRRGYIQIPTPKTNGKPGRPKERIYINPNYQP